MTDETTPQDDKAMSPASAGSVGSDLYGGGFNKWLESIGKTRETATDADEVQWLKLDRQRIRGLLGDATCGPSCEPATEANRQG
jgi:hypothetical protein